MDRRQLHGILALTAVAAVFIAAAVANTASLWAQLLPAYNVPARRVANCVGVPLVLTVALLCLGPPAEGQAWSWRKLARHFLQALAFIWCKGLSINLATTAAVAAIGSQGWLISTIFHRTYVEQSCSDLPVWTWKQTFLHVIPSWVPCDWADARTLQTIAVAVCASHQPLAASLLDVPLCVLLWNFDNAGLCFWGWVRQPHLSGAYSAASPRAEPTEEAGAAKAEQPPRVFQTSTGEEEWIVD